MAGTKKNLWFYSRGQRAKRACLHAHLATAARVKYPAALQRYKFDAPLLAAWSLTLTAVLIVSLTACGKVSNKSADVIQRENPAGVENSENSNGAAETEDSSGGVPAKTAGDEKIEKGKNIMYITVGDSVMTMKLADNASAEAFRGLAASGPFTVEMKEYGGFELVGALGERLPAADEQILAEPGDVMLYQGNSVTIFYGTNSWSYTRLGEIENMDQKKLVEIFGDGDVTVSFSLEE